MKYKLLKDTPTINARTIGELDPETNLIGFRTTSDVAGRYWEFFSIEFVSSKQDWFEPVIERWRAARGENYYYTDGTRPVKTEDTYGSLDTEIYISGNYFRTSDQATEVAKRIKQTLMDYHKEIGEQI